MTVIVKLRDVAANPNKKFDLTCPRFRELGIRLHSCVSCPFQTGQMCQVGFLRPGKIVLCIPVESICNGLERHRLTL